MDISVETASGVTITLQVNPEDTISAVRSKIADKDGVAADQTFAFAGRPLEEDMTVASAGLQAGSTIQHVGAYWQGEGTLRVPMVLHTKNRSRLMDQFDAPDVPPNSFIVLQGGTLRAQLQLSQSLCAPLHWKYCSP